MRRRHAARALTVLAFTLLLLLAVAPIAYASTESTYTAWTDPGFNHSEPHDTPHNGYGTTTTKCSVCHAVHKAPAAGEVLLRTTVGEACVYCHIDTNLGVIQIYNGDSSLYYIDNKKNHSLGGGVACTDCHAVHGANTYGTYLATKILKRLPIQPTFVRLFSESNDSNVLYEAVEDVTGNMWPAPPYDWEQWDRGREVQQTAFCTGCHPYYTRNDGTDPITVEGVQYNSHPMKRYFNSVDGDGNWVVDFQAPGSTIPSTTQVAGMSSHGCLHCHGERAFLDAGPGVQPSSFPHYTANRERFLVSGNGDSIDLDTADSRQDGTCFQCHLWWDGANYQGVGYTY
jgi:predicted CXXCH cytochrome family protein